MSPKGTPSSNRLPWAAALVRTGLIAATAIFASDALPL
jgi:hypothetical protein